MRSRGGSGRSRSFATGRGRRNRLFRFRFWRFRTNAGIGTKRVGFRTVALLLPRLARFSFGCCEGERNGPDRLHDPARAFLWWAMRDLNPRPCPCKGPALPLRQSPVSRRCAAAFHSRIEPFSVQRILRNAVERCRKPCVRRALPATLQMRWRRVRCALGARRRRARFGWQRAAYA